MRFIVVFFCCSISFTCGCGSQSQLNDETSQNVAAPQNVTAPKSQEIASDDSVASIAMKQLKTKYSDDVSELKQKLEAAQSDGQRKQILATSNPSIKYIDDLQMLAKQYPQTQTAVFAALEAVSRSSGETKNNAMIFLIENFAPKLEYAKMIKSFQEDVPSRQIENWLKKMIEFAPPSTIRARAIMGYCKYVDQIPAYRDGFVKNPHLMAKLPSEQQKYLHAERTTNELSKIESLLRDVIENYPDDKFQRGRTFADVAKTELYELQNLTVGKIAPDVIGHDLDGVEFKLSDYRGKIVMLDFWGHWCGPCRQMYPEERAMVSKLASAPFALVGMNSDQDIETAREAVREEGLSWRHFWNGKKGTRGPIAEQWNVEAWPTVYLIDGDGVIRYKDILGEDLDRALEKLLAEAGHVTDLSNLN